MIPVEISLAEVRGESSLCFVAALRDIRDRRRQEEALRAHMAALERRNRELDHFAYVASHDLKAPLRAIANLASWIEEDLEDRLEGETRRQLELLRGRVQRMEALIDGLLAYSRAGRSAVQPEAVSVEALLAEVVDSLDPPAGMRIEGGDLPTLVTDRLRLSQVLANLVGNAIKYHHDPHHGRVEVSAEDLGDRFRFTVADDGSGIDPRFHERIFQIFQTLQPRDSLESTGIGLALVKKIVEELGGEIELDSAPGEGARFQFTWPKEIAQT